MTNSGPGCQLQILVECNYCIAKDKNLYIFFLSNFKVPVFYFFLVLNLYLSQDDWKLLKSWACAEWKHDMIMWYNSMLAEFEVSQGGGYR